jgi:hypothetical protein
MRVHDIFEHRREVARLDRHPLEHKYEMSREIEQLTEEFIKSGGKITEVPPDATGEPEQPTKTKKQHEPQGRAPNARFTDEQVKHIRQAAKTKKGTKIAEEMSAILGSTVSPSTIYDILYRRTYVDVR